VQEALGDYYVYESDKRQLFVADLSDSFFDPKIKCTAHTRLPFVTDSGRSF